MPPADKRSGPDKEPKDPQGRRHRRRGGRGGRARRLKPQPAREPSVRSGNTLGEHPLSHHTWDEYAPSGWGAEQNSGWAQPNDDWAMETYTGTKIEAWIQQVAACGTSDIARPSSATSEAEAPSVDDANDDTGTSVRQVNLSLYQWALDFLNRTAVSPGRKRRALHFLSQSQRQQHETIYGLLQELRHL